MESPPLRPNVAREEDRISALPDHLLLGILERIGLRSAVRAAALSTRWRHLPHQLSRLKLAVRRSLAHMPVDAMDEFTDALLSVCPPAERSCDCQRGRAIKTLRLAFFLSAPHLSFISRAVEDVASRGQTKCLDFCIRPPYVRDSQLAEFGQQFMSLSRACPIAFRCLTRLTLLKLEFGRSDVADLISACARLEFLSLQSCGLVEHSALKIDTPCSRLQELQLILFRCTWIELISVPKLRQVQCQSWRSENPPVCFDYVPELRKVSLISDAKAGQVPFYLSECLRNARNLSILHLQFFFQMIWIQPEHPKQLTAVFRNLMNVYLSDIFPECDLIWTLFILEAAQSLQNFGLSRSRHSCVRTPEDSAEKTNVVWEPSKDFKHLNLKLLQMSGFEEEDKVTTYIRLVMERAVGLKKIELQGYRKCWACNATDADRKSQVDEASRRRIKERLANGSSSPVEIIIC